MKRTTRLLAAALLTISVAVAAGGAIARATSPITPIRYPADRVPVGNGVYISPAAGTQYQGGDFVTVTKGGRRSTVSAIRAGAGRDPGEILQEFFDVQQYRERLAMTPVRTWTGSYHGHVNLRYSGVLYNMTDGGGHVSKGDLELVARDDGLVVLIDNVDPYEDTDDEDLIGIEDTVDSLVAAPAVGPSSSWGPTEHVTITRPEPSVPLPYDTTRQVPLLPGYQVSLQRPDALTIEGHGGMVMFVSIPNVTSEEQATSIAQYLLPNDWHASLGNPYYTVEKSASAYLQHAYPVEGRVRWATRKADASVFLTYDDEHRVCTFVLAVSPQGKDAVWSDVTTMGSVGYEAMGPLLVNDD